MIGSEALWLAQIIKTSMDVMNPPNNLDRYLKAIGADLPLPEAAEGWWQQDQWMVIRVLPEGSSRRFAMKEVYRWRPFSSY